jgi:peptide-methionine (S)-S-oxide reductase
MNQKIATFAAGCFWSVEAIFRGCRGVIDTSVGFMGGHFKNPEYEDVLTDTTGHAEVAQIIYDEDIITYDVLLRMLFKSHNPTILPGTKYKYRSSIFYHEESQKELADKFLKALQSRYEKSITTTVVEASDYYLASAKHQHYYEKKHKLPSRIKRNRV